MKTTRAFTLIELLVVIAIIAVLASLAKPVLNSFRKVGDRTHALNNLKQLGSGMMIYAAEHNNELPGEGEDQPTWQSAGDPENYDAWYNAIPRLLKIKAIADFAQQPETFYNKKNLLFIPAAQYPEDKKDRPYFAVSMNSKLRSKKAPVVHLANIQQPAQTVIFQESGMPGEKELPGQNAAKYDGQSKSFASRTVARYAGKTIMIFGEGSTRLLDAKNVVDPNGKAFFPQIGEDGGEVLWTPDPEADAN